MPVKVNVPVHIVIDPETATSHLDHVETALTEAARRALLNARATLEKTHGVVARQHAQEPVVSWSGPGLPSVTADTRHRAEALVHQVLTTVQADTLPVRPLPPDSRAALSAEGAHALQARAYTRGHEIAFGPGQYAPATDEGKCLLAHELVDTYSLRPGSRFAGRPINRHPRRAQTTS